MIQPFETLIIDGSESSFSRCLSLLNTFAMISGLKANYEKTEALWIGAYREKRGNYNSIF